MEMISGGTVLYSDAGPCGEACMGCVSDCGDCLHCPSFCPVDICIECLVQCFCPVNA